MKRESKELEKKNFRHPNDECKILQVATAGFLAGTKTANASCIAAEKMNTALPTPTENWVFQSFPVIKHQMKQFRRFSPVGVRTKLSKESNL